MKCLMSNLEIVERSATLSQDVNFEVETQVRNSNVQSSFPLATEFDKPIELAVEW